MVLLEKPIETKDLILRSLRPGDAHGPYAAWMHDPVVTRYLEARSAPPDQAELEVYIAAMNDSRDNLLVGMFPLTAPGRHIGNAKIGPIDRRHQTAALGIAIGAKEHWGKGLATQALAALARHAFTALGLERLEAGFYAGNVASLRAFRSIGFVEEGRRRGARCCEGLRVDEIIMGLLRDRPDTKDKR